MEPQRQCHSPERRTALVVYPINLWFQRFLVAEKLNPSHAVYNLEGCRGKPTVKIHSFSVFSTAHAHPHMKKHLHEAGPLPPPFGLQPRAWFASQCFDTVPPWSLYDSSPAISWKSSPRKVEMNEARLVNLNFLAEGTQIKEDQQALEKWWKVHLF